MEYKNELIDAIDCIDVEFIEELNDIFISKNKVMAIIKGYFEYQGRDMTIGDWAKDELDRRGIETYD